MMRLRLSSRTMLKLWFKTLFYNSSFGFNYAMDTFAQPVFWLVDHFARYLGKICVFTVYALIGAVVILAYLLGLQIYWRRSPTLSIALIILGNWILVNILFHYYHAVTVSPGLPTDYSQFLGGQTPAICKKCIHPKPPRTHHCSICNRCYLKMDHHCPWINNCVGHFNHRYFFLTMIYLVIGCFFVMIFGLDTAYRQVIQGVDVLPFESLEKEDLKELALENSGLKSTSTNDEEDESTPYYFYFITGPSSIFLYPFRKMLFPEGNEKASLLFGIMITRCQLLGIVYFVGSLCIAAFAALGGLAIWHGKLISRGETSIEYHINKAERKEAGQKFVNPYDLGIRKNWQVFLGLDQKSRSVVWHVLLPSTHPPSGNGYDWSHLRALEGSDLLKSM